jgi:uncharacterized membrane protein YgcG
VPVIHCRTCNKVQGKCTCAKPNFRNANDYEMPYEHHEDGDVADLIGIGLELGAAALGASILGGGSDESAPEFGGGFEGGGGSSGGGGSEGEW